MERYYVKVKGMEGSRVAHMSLADAYTEARRLFDLNEQKRRVYVLQVVGTLEPKETPVGRTPHDRKGEHRTSPRGKKANGIAAPER